MFKFLLLLFLFIYVIAKVGGFIFRALFSNFTSQARQQTYQSNGSRAARQPKDGNVIINYNPKDRRQSKDGGSFKGGDYVNYEEVD
ncbi:DUF4834 family protein [Reichenbachiella carrageenanivorans]|uniref:DUF4834 family protein n=1 Tax=Reichenbachiella carrageenanivorans TaxID=2979869 RepID=A0ABY6D3Y3_9BACT|nr:DUF4834 family protein [Reichenbachiella carrageenanivorans]UXX80340.1 DUF4834 family protein [Reichenbachiella carrageenanivorans]